MRLSNEELVEYDPGTIGALISSQLRNLLDSWATLTMIRSAWQRSGSGADSGEEQDIDMEFAMAQKGMQAVLMRLRETDPRWTREIDRFVADVEEGRGTWLWR